MWFLSPSGWPLYATGSLLADRLTAQGWTALDPSQVQDAIDAYNAGLAPLPLGAAFDAVLTPTTGDQTSRINAALAATNPFGTRRKVKLIGDFTTSAPLIVPSRTLLDATDAVITLAAGSNCNMLQNTAVTAVTRTFDPTTGAYTATGPRDADITVRGGLWDRQDNNGSPANGVNSHSLRFRHVDGLTVEDVAFAATGGKYQLNPGDCTRIRIVGVSAPAVSSDTVHLNGPCSDVVIRDVRGGTVGDDMVSFTARDSTAVITDCAGDITDVLVENVYFATAQAGLFSSALKIIAGQSDDGGRKFTVSRLTARNLTGPNTTASVVFCGDSSGGTFDDITLEGVRSLGGASNQGCVLLHGGTVGRLTARDVRPAPDDWYAVSVDTTVDRLTVEDAQWNATIGSIPFMVYVTGTLTRLVESGCHLSGNNGALLRVENGGTVKQALLRDNTLQGDACAVWVPDAGTNPVGVLSSVSISGFASIGATLPLGVYGSVTTLSLSDINSTGTSANWLEVTGVGAVTVKGASGLSGSATTYSGALTKSLSNTFTA